MATFRVGQRVRIKHSNQWPILNGMEGVIVARANNMRDIFGVVGEWRVRPSCWSSEWAPDGQGYFAPHSSQLEPILDRHEPCESEFKKSLDKLLSEVREREAV